MGLIDFVKEAGEKLFGKGTAQAAMTEVKADPANEAKIKAANDAAGDAIVGLDLTLAADRDSGEIGIRLRHDFAVAQRAIDRLLAGPAAAALFGAAPFPRQPLLQALFAELGAPLPAACCQAAALLPPARLELAAVAPGAAGSDAAALVAIADRLDTVVACFGIGLAPTGTADPFGLRRAVLGILRTMLDRGFDLSLSAMIKLAEAQLSGVKLDVSSADLGSKLLDFMGERLRGVLIDKHPHDAVRAALGAGFDRPLDARKRIVALAGLPAELRSRVGEVFKRATNIAGQAPAGDPSPPAADAHKSEAALFEVYRGFASRADELTRAGDYAALLTEIGTIAPVMHQYFVDVLVMCEDVAVRENRLRLMRAISIRITARFPEKSMRSLCRVLS